MPVAGSPSLSPPPVPDSESGSTNVPGLDYAPPSSPDLTDTILQQIDFGPPYSPDSLGSIKGWYYVPPSPGSPTEWRLPVGSMPVAGSPSISPPPPAPKSGSTNVYGLEHAPTPSLDSTSWEELMQMLGMAEKLGYTGSPLPAPVSSGSSTGLDYVPPSAGSSTGSRLPVGPIPVAGSLSPPPPHPGQPWPSEHRFPSPSGFSANPDTLSSASHKPAPQSPGVDPETHPLFDLEPFEVPAEAWVVWDDFLKGKIERRISGSDAVNLAQKDSRSRMFYL